MTIMTHKEICREVFLLCNHADEPTHNNRESEYKRAFGAVWMAHKVGALTDSQYMNLYRAVCDQYYMYDKDDHRELAKANQYGMDV